MHIKIISPLTNISHGEVHVAQLSLTFVNHTGIRFNSTEYNKLDGVQYHGPYILKSSSDILWTMSCHSPYLREFSSLYLGCPESLTFKEINKIKSSTWTDAHAFEQLHVFIAKSHKISRQKDRTFTRIRGEKAQIETHAWRDFSQNNKKTPIRFNFFLGRKPGINRRQYTLCFSWNENIFVWKQCFWH